jgi:hypothetical protein
MDPATDVKVGSTPSEEAGSGINAQTRGMLSTMASPGTPVTKVIVAVHGVGDQYSYATIQSVVSRFCGFYGLPAAVPLGNFHTGQAAFSISPPYPPDPFQRFAFAEVYWARIPRTLVDDKHTLEEAKKWARTIVERLRMRWKAEGERGDWTEADFALLTQVLTEMIQTIAVLDRLFYLSDKAGLFTFDLKKLLEAYLGDIQIVTEFSKQRGEILQTFADVMAAVHEKFRDAEIYIVAHSEGTVVSFLGLLQAFRDPQSPGWERNVRGFMTLGSPIDKHLALWPELFGEEKRVRTPTKKIEWRNYYDFGDPIGFALDDARAWLRACQWDDVFSFTKADDIGFTRYPFPGKAHVDYWTDGDLFRHFIATVVKETPGRPAGARAEPQTTDPATPPGNVRSSQFLSYVLPYVGVTALLVVAAYLLFKAVAGAIDPEELGLHSTWAIAKGVSGITGLLFGITLVARVPRLTRSLFWRGIAVGIGIVLTWVYLWSVPAIRPSPPPGSSLSAIGVALLMAVLLVGLVCVLSAVRPSWGFVPLMLLGTAAVGYSLLSAGGPADLGPLWPVVLATIGFLYLWWLAALLFDLIFVWHLYIRHARMLSRIDEILGWSREKPRATDGRSSQRPCKPRGSDAEPRWPIESPDATSNRRNK